MARCYFQKWVSSEFWSLQVIIHRFLGVLVQRLQLVPLLLQLLLQLLDDLLGFGAVGFQGYSL